ncbi:MAG: hybrid sensor histidine kinase/response regulator [Candidatus Acidiferrales bacterium]
MTQTKAKHEEQGTHRGIPRAGRELTDSEERFAQLFESLEEGVYFSTPEGWLLDGNPALVRMLGYENKEELRKTDPRKILQDPEKLPILLEELRKEGAFRSRIITLLRKDGTPVQFLNSCTAVRDSAGNILRLQGTLTNLTERLELEKRLHQEQEFARRLVESIPDAIVVLDTNSCYTFLSSRIREISGYAPEELIGRKLGERIMPEDQSAIHELFVKITSGQSETGVIEYRTFHKDGSIRLFRAHAAPLRDAEGRISGLVATARDVTELKKLEQQLMQSEKLAAIGQMIAGVAHELNNPLTAILGISDLLLERAPDETTRRQTNLVHKQARRAADIVQSLLAFSRPAVAERRHVSLANLVQRSLDLHEDSLRKNGITIEFQVDPGLPLVAADSNQLIQVFLNLLVNGVQAIRSVRDGGTVRIRITRRDGKQSVSFEDEGPGVSSEALPKIFDPFFTTKRPGGGTGLGLTICLAIAREHGGTIEYQPAPAGGAIFRVELPESSDALAPASAPVSRSRAAALDGRSVLIVDDEEGIREIVGVGLSARGMRVECAATVAEARESLSSQAHDFVLCDLHLPGASGEEILSEVQSQPSSSPPRFFFMTGDLLDKNKLEFFHAKGAGVIQKPFQISELAAILTDTLVGVESRS